MRIQPTKLAGVVKSCIPPKQAPTAPQIRKAVEKINRSTPTQEVSVSSPIIQKTYETDGALKRLMSPVNAQHHVIGFPTPAELEKLRAAEAAASAERLAYLDKLYNEVCRKIY